MDETGRVTILAPAYNEEAVLERFFDAVLPRLAQGWELLVVDDGSTDRTPEIASAYSRRDPRVRVVTHHQNLGLGAALVSGFRAAAGHFVVTLDADLSHPVDMISDMVAACREVDAVLASRYVPGGGMAGVPALRVFISRFANLALRLLFWTSVRDLTTGFRAYRSEVVRDLPVVASRFDAQLEITVRLIASGCTIRETPLLLTQRAAGESKMRYLPLVGRYGRTVTRMLAMRWLGKT